MDEVSTLIEKFRAEGARTARDGGPSGKDEIVRRLSSFDDERVLPFLLEVLEDGEEYDLARIEVLKFLNVMRRGDRVRDEGVARLVRHVLTNDSDDDVRSYAAIAVSNFMDVDGSAEAARSVLLNREEDEALRWNAFAAFEGMGPTPESISALTACEQDDELGDSATQVLGDWRAAN